MGLTSIKNIGNSIKEVIERQKMGILKVWRFNGKSSFREKGTWVAN